MPDKTNKNSKPVLIICLFVLSIIAAGLFVFRDQLFSPADTPGKTDSGTELSGPNILPTDQEKEEASVLDARVKSELAEITEDIPLSEDRCREFSSQIERFFSRLDSREYMGAFKLETGSREHFNKLTSKLFSNPPIVVRETDDLFAILKNISHFYRIIGKNDISLIKEILLAEARDIEETMALFFRWPASEELCRKNMPGSAGPTGIRLPLDGLYEYAGFFLDTLGGQSYLFRRKPRVRMLVKYYSILIIDQANARSMNRHGIDIRYPTNSLIEEMEVSQDLKYRAEYLQRLYELQDRYRREYGEKKG